MLLLRKLSFWLALAGVAACALLVARLHASLSQPMPPPPVAPAVSPFAHSLGSDGIVEASTDNRAIGVPAPGLVMSVPVKVWDRVKAGAPLLQLDTRDLQAELLPERAQVKVAEATLERVKGILSRLEAVQDPRAITPEDLQLDRSNVDVAEAQLEAARAAVKQTEDLIARMTVRAPIDGTILKVNLRSGEYTSPNSAQAPIVMGNIDEEQVRADIDEQLAPRMRSGAKAVAFVKGDSRHPITLTFVRIEPDVIPKVSLTGDSTERVDTRVLQVIYTFRNPKEHPIYVGQQMDVYIDAGT